MRSALHKVEGVESIDVGPIDKKTKSAFVQVKGTASKEALVAAFKGTQYSADVK